MKFVNVYMDGKGLWSASLCLDAERVIDVSEVSNIGGSYPKAINAERDAKNKWGSKLDVRVSYGPMFVSEGLKRMMLNMIEEGIPSSHISEKLRIREELVLQLLDPNAQGGDTTDDYEEL